MNQPNQLNQRIQTEQRTSHVRNRGVCAGALSMNRALASMLAQSVGLRNAPKLMFMFLFLAAMVGFTAPEPNSLRAVLAVETLSASVLTSEAMTLQFRAKSGLTYELALVRNATTGFWAMSGTALDGMPGVMFGNTRLRFATSAALTSMGVAPTEAIREASPAIVGQIYDDVSIIRTLSGDGGICLWSKGVITRVWFTGGFIAKMLAIMPDHADMCAAGLVLCCAQETIGASGFERVVPAPHNAACDATAANCPMARDAACLCLNAACMACRDPEPPCGEPRQEVSNNACIIGITKCSPEVSPIDPPPTAWVEAILQLLREILERLQRIRDTMPNPN